MENEYSYKEDNKMDKQTTSVIAYITWIGLLVAILAGDKEGAKFHVLVSFGVYLF